MEQNTSIATKTLASLDGWAERKSDLIKFVDEMGALTVEQFATSGVRKSGKAQALSVLLHCSSGYIGDKFRDKSGAEVHQVICDLIAPDLTPEQIKQRNYDTAAAALKTLREQKVAEPVISTVISAMPEGKRVLADNPAK